MNLLINEWRKFIHRIGLAITFPILQLITTIIYFFAISRFGKISDSKIVFSGSSEITIFFVLTLGMLYAATTLTSEFSSGTIKFILTRPYDRHKILLAKIGSATIITTALAIISEVINYLIGFISFGRAPEISVILKQSCNTVLIVFLGILFYGTFAIMVTVLVNSSSLSTALTFIYYTSAAPLWYAVSTAFLKLSTDSWMYKLSPFNVNNNLVDIIKKSKIDLNGDLIVLLAANIVYICLFYLIADIVFNKKDISLSK